MNNTKGSHFEIEILKILKEISMDFHRRIWNSQTRPVVNRIYNSGTPRQEHLS
nr:12468_t:CDS:2 [Entrophospora candida]